MSERAVGWSPGAGHAQVHAIPRCAECDGEALAIGDAIPAISAPRTHFHDRVSLCVQA